MLKLPNKLLGLAVHWILYKKIMMLEATKRYKTDISATMAINLIQWVWFSTGHNGNHSVCYEHLNEPPGRVEHLCRIRALRINGSVQGKMVVSCDAME